jgi:ribosomal protein L12E/L44/L45/RPP1/RPP2
MTLTIDVKDDGVLTLLRDMERLDLLHVATPAAVSPAAVPSAPANSDAEYLNRKAREAHDIELINRDAEWLNAEALDVLSYQDLDL